MNLVYLSIVFTLGKQNQHSMGFHVQYVALDSHHE
jgi:hypothetical protein